MASALRYARVQRIMRAVLHDLQEDREARTPAGRARIALAQAYMGMEVVGFILKHHYEAARDEHGSDEAHRRTLCWYWYIIAERGGFQWLKKREEGRTSE